MKFVRCVIALVALLIALVPSAHAQTDEELRRMYFKKDFAALEALAHKGDVRAEAWMGLIMQQASRRADAKMWWARAAKQGNRWAIGSLAAMHHQDKEFEQALAWYRRGAELGDPDLQATLAARLLGVTGYPQDEREAVRWYRAAVEQRHAHSYARLAELYAAGRGTARDPAEAHALARIAEAVLTDSDESERARARKLRTELAKTMSPAELERAQLRVRELRPDLAGLFGPGAKRMLFIVTLLGLGLFSLGAIVWIVNRRTAARPRT